MQEIGLIEKLDPEGTKKSTTYIATQKGIDALPIICEMYLFSIDLIDESILDEMQLDVKKQISSDKKLFQQQKISQYKAFVEDLRSELEISKISKQ